MKLTTRLRVLIAICTLPFLFISVVGLLQIYYDGIAGFDVSLLFALVATFIGGYLVLMGRTPTQSTKSD